MRLATDEDWEMWRRRRWFTHTLVNYDGLSYGLRINTPDNNRWVIPGVPDGMFLTVVHFDQSGDCLFKVNNHEIGNRHVGQSYVTESPDEAAAVLAAVPFVIQTMPLDTRDPADPSRPENMREMWLRNPGGGRGE